MAELTRTKIELRKALRRLDGDVALVMTMGALHEGHLTLVRAARAEAAHVVVSIFVNPLQFGPGEDFDAYPRDLDADLALLETVGVDVVFAPEADEVYPREPLVRLDPGPVASQYEGRTRPTHFAGVLQVVNKVFNLVGPDVAFFGQKDAQQLALIRTMVADLDMPVRICSVPIKRESSGLALSSRNAYLSEDESIEALAINQSLVLGKDAAAHGATPSAARDVVLRYIGQACGVRLDYVALVDPDSFEDLAVQTEQHEVPTEQRGDRSAPSRGLLVIAAWVGATRLIDNMEVEFHD